MRKGFLNIVVLLGSLIIVVWGFVIYKNGYNFPTFSDKSEFDTKIHGDEQLDSKSGVQQQFVLPTSSPKASPKSNSSAVLLPSSQSGSQSTSTNQGGIKAKVYWVIPQGQSPISGFESGLVGLLEKSRQFFSSQLSGETFYIDGGVQKIQSTRTASWFYGCDSGECGYSEKQWRENNIGWIWGRVKQDLATKGISVAEEGTYTIVIVSPGTFQYGTGGGYGLGGTSLNMGMAVIGEQKTAGSLGLHSSDDYCLPVESENCKNQVVGSFVHEIGHSLGLEHPINVEDQNASIMWSWWSYPNIGLTQIEKNKLNSVSAIW